jgi:hypothetical protein
MNIRFTSSLTPEDENRLAPVVLKAFSSILDLLPIAYMIRIETSDAQSYEYNGLHTIEAARRSAIAVDPDYASIGR